MIAPVINDSLCQTLLLNRGSSAGVRTDPIVGMATIKGAVKSLLDIDQVLAGNAGHDFVKV
jgi:hypothetical protein